MLKGRRKKRLRRWLLQMGKRLVRRGRSLPLFKMMNLRVDQTSKKHHLIRSRNLRKEVNRRLKLKRSCQRKEAKEVMGISLRASSRHLF
jgi:hypothetical protein